MEEVRTLTPNNGANVVSLADRKPDIQKKYNPFDEHFEDIDDLTKSSGKFIIEKLAIPEVVLIRPKNVFADRRGLFCETYRFGDLAKTLNHGLMPVQGSLSISGAFTLRGMHYQLNNPQGKFIQIAQGRIFDVAIDMRKNSPTFGKWCGAVLDARQPGCLYIPPRFAHGFMTFESGATVFYLCTTYHDAASDQCVKYDDPAIGIEWPVGAGAVLTISAKDRNAPRLADAKVFQ